jgi:tetratricopeptide (TPR) repeat protein
MRQLHPEFLSGPLTTTEELTALMEMNELYPFYYYGETQRALSPGYSAKTTGLVTRIARRHDSGTAAVLLQEIYVYRGLQDAAATTVSSFSADYARAFLSAAAAGNVNGDIVGAHRDIRTALSFNRTFPDAAMLEAAMYIKSGDHKSALASCAAAVRMYDVLFEQIPALSSLEGERNDLQRRAAEAAMQAGICAERSNNDEAAIVWYSNAISRVPLNADYYFKRAIVYDKREDWNNEISDLMNVLRIDPSYNAAEYYVQQARIHLRDGKEKAQ